MAANALASVGECAVLCYRCHAARLAKPGLTEPGHATSYSRDQAQIGLDGQKHFKIVLNPERFASLPG